MDDEIATHFPLILRWRGVWSQFGYQHLLINFASRAFLIRNLKNNPVLRHAERKLFLPADALSYVLSA